MNNSDTSNIKNMESLVNSGKKAFETIKAGWVALAPFIGDVAVEIQNSIKNLEKYKIDRKIDVDFLKHYRKKNNSEIVIARVKPLLDNMLDSPEKRKMMILKDEFVIAEYDKVNDRIIQSDFIYTENIADNIMTALNSNGDIIIVAG